MGPSVFFNSKLWEIRDRNNGQRLTMMRTKNIIYVNIKFMGKHDVWCIICHEMMGSSLVHLFSYYFFSVAIFLIYIFFSSIYFTSWIFIYILRPQNWFGHKIQNLNLATVHIYMDCFKWISMLLRFAVNVKKISLFFFLVFFSCAIFVQRKREREKENPLFITSFISTN